VRDAQPELVGLSEIAGRLGVTYPTVLTWRYRHHRQPRPPWQSFPEPIKTVGRSPVFDWTEVEQWAKATGRLET